MTSLLTEWPKEAINSVQPVSWAEISKKNPSMLSNLKGSASEIFGTAVLFFDVGEQFPLHPGAQEFFVPVNSTSFKEYDGKISALKVTYWPALNKKPEAPTFVYLPGVFQDAQNIYTYRIIKLALNQGYQVLIIPNGLSSDYFRQYPTAMPANFTEEANVAAAAIRWFQRGIGKTSINASSG